MELHWLPGLDAGRLNDVHIKHCPETCRGIRAHMLKLAALRLRTLMHPMHTILEYPSHRHTELGTECASLCR